MKHARFALLATVSAFFALAIFAAPPVERPIDVGGKAGQSAKNAHEIIQEFPSNDTMKTAWKVQWAKSSGYGLYLQGAWFKRGPLDPWLQVLGDARLAEMFVPYHSGSPRFWDVSYNFDMTKLSAAEAGPLGKLHAEQTVCQELRDRGLMWLDGGSKPGRRGQSLVLWGVLDAANYRYITEFSFQDDGVIAFRVGSTGRNYGTREFEGHMHNGLWRVDVNLGGFANNSAYVMEHIEPDKNPANAKTTMRPFNKGVEGFEDWHAEKFTMLNIVNETMRNARKQLVSYDVVTARMGNARHYGDKEECTHHDFWISANRKGEIYYPKVPEYVKDGAPIMKTDIVLWLSTACHHDPRSEDGAFVEGNFIGATPVAWSGFELRPRNVFDRTPHYPY